MLNDNELEYLRDFDPQTVHEVPRGTPFAIYITGTEHGPDGTGFVPSVVYRNVGGHFPLRGRDGGSPWVWGPSRMDAAEQAAQYNAQLGLSEEQVRDIVLSSFTQAVDQGKL